MPDRFWRILLPESHHVVELEHNYSPGVRTIRLDGHLLHESRHFLDLGSAHPFRVGDHDCSLVISRTGWNFDYDLYLDGRPLASMEPVPGGD